MTGYTNWKTNCPASRCAGMLCLFLFPASVAVPGSARAIEIEDRYWKYDGQKVLLIGGWNHGHNPFLDHDTVDANGRSGASSEKQITAALDELAEAGGNLLRCVLDPGVGAGVQGFDFCAKSGDLYDLNEMTGPYWTRLDFFLREAHKRKIVVQIEIWDRFDWYDGGHEGWPKSPFNPKNNVNYTTTESGLRVSYPGKGDKTGNPFGQGVPGLTLYDKADASRRRQFDIVRGYQEKFMDKLLSLTLAYDNVLYSMDNEVRHQEPAWGEYWLAYVRKTAAARNQTVLCTDMFWDLLRLPGPTKFDYLMANADQYDYFDVSQTSAHPATGLAERKAGAAHWEKIIYAAKHAKDANRLLHMNKIYGSDDRARGWMGSAENAVGEFWRSLIAGVAGVRFHRPESGIGLSEQSNNCMRAVRLVEQNVEFWDVEPSQDLLTDCALDEVYLATHPGHKYVLFFTDGGSVGLKLDDYADVRFQLAWIKISSGTWGATEELVGGSTVAIRAPAEGPWVATIVRE